MVISEEKLLVQQECLDRIREAGFNASFFLPTGAGKAKILVDAIRELHDLGLINSVYYVCDNREMRDEDFPVQMRLWGAADLLDITTCICYATAYKMTPVKTGLRIYDEADYAAGTDKLSLSFEKIQADYTLICSATGTLEQKEYIHSIAPIVYEKSLKELEDRGVINKSKYFFINYLLTLQENKEYLDLTKDISVKMAQKDEYEIKMSLLKRKHFLSGLFSGRLATKELIKYIDSNLNNPRILVFSQLTEQIDKILVHTFHEKNANEDNLRKFNELRFNKLGVVGKIIRGKNLVGVDHLIFESANSSSTRMLQASGRGKRLDKNDFSCVYFMIPHFVKPSNNKVYSTVVEDWIFKAAQKLNIDYLKEHWINY